MAEAFKIADAYVEVNTRYDGNEFVRRLDGTLGRHANRITAIGRNRVGRPMAKGMLAGSVVAFATGFVKAISLGMANVNVGTAFKSSPWLVTAGMAIAGSLVATVAAGVAATLLATLAGVFGVAMIGLAGFLLRKNKAIGDAGKRLGKTFSTEFGDAAKVFVKPIIKAFDLIGEAIKRNRPIIDRIFGTLAPVLVPLTKGLIGFLEAMAPGLEALGRVAALVLLDLAKALPGWGKSMGDFFIKIEKDWPKIRESLHQFFSDFGTALGMVASALIWLGKNYNNFRAIFAGITHDITATVKLFANVFSWVTGGWKKDWNSLKSGLHSWANSVIGYFRDLPTRARNAVHMLWPNVRISFAQLRAGLITWALLGISGFIGKWKTLPGKASGVARDVRARIKSVFSGAADWLIGAGRQVISGFISGIRGMIPSLSGVLSGITSSLPDWKGPRERDRSILKPAGRLVISGFQEGIREGTADLKRQLGALTGGMPGMVGAVAGASNVSVSLSVHVPAGSNGTRIGREAALAIKQALLDLERSRKRRA
jgi:hypothetical protein